MSFRSRPIPCGPPLSADPHTSVRCRTIGSLQPPNLPQNQAAFQSQVILRSWYAPCIPVTEQSQSRHRLFVRPDGTIEGSRPGELNATT
jgi:hypothetical protein